MSSSTAFSSDNSNIFVEVLLTPNEETSTASMSTKESNINKTQSSANRHRVTFLQEDLSASKSRHQRRSTSLSQLAQLEHAFFVAHAAHHTPPIRWDFGPSSPIPDEEYDADDEEIVEKEASRGSTTSAGSPCSSDSYSLASSLECGEIPPDDRTWDRYADEFRAVTISARKHFLQGEEDGPFNLNRARPLSQSLKAYALATANVKLDKPLPAINQRGRKLTLLKASTMKPLPPVPSFTPLPSPILALPTFETQSSQSRECPHTADTISAMPVWGALAFRASGSPYTSFTSSTPLHLRRNRVPELAVTISPPTDLPPIQVFRASPPENWITPRSPPPAYTRVAQRKVNTAEMEEELDAFESLKRVLWQGTVNKTKKQVEQEKGWLEWVGDWFDEFISEA